ncbi:hypothetical protein ACI0FM_00595 [Paenochrobactrum sp. BZR 588]|uniref:hypothetical protein n=1 Tax=Paenochrobactrum TaxID=999488 RepID=UPI0035BC4147
MAWPILKWATVIGLALGFGAGTLSMLSGNIISMNGTALSGWYGVWSLTLALGIGGFFFGLIGALLVRAIGIAAEK